MSAYYTKLLKKAQEYVAISTWDPDRIFTKAKDVKIWLNNESFLDFGCGPGVGNIGHNHSEVIEAVIRVLKNNEAGWGGNELLNKHQINLSERLCEITPGKFSKRVFFSNSGGEAVEAAVIACLRRRPERRGMLSFIGDFHGRLGFGRTATTSRQILFEGLPQGIEKAFYLIFPAENPETPEKKKFLDNFSTPEEYMSYVENTIGPFINEINFALLELVQGEGGINKAKKEIIQQLIEYLREHKVWIIIDEVQSGLGRTGKMWASDIYEVEPDIITIAKALSGGIIPIGATVLRENLGFKQLKEHCNTFGGGPLACAAGLKVLDIIEKDELCKKSERQGKFLRERLKIAKSNCPQADELVYDISGHGLMSRITFQNLDNDTPASEVRDMVATTALELGLFLMSAGERSVRLMPPLTVNNQEIEKAVKIVIQAINKVHSKL
ncbi:MAG: aminotransferase class III-fold pyridoxal phosphate-dependent enzyme [Patescibacteria group bacterium]